ncbi:transposase [Methanobrevibacter olleyae]|uniref:Transposase n=1 Tax=Methanobrevibacter olleyae TaxID=294671 RepID=A0A126QX48_METOL|nr:transposase [Methanobrevibacter olleyae]
MFKNPNLEKFNKKRLDNILTYPLAVFNVNKENNKRKKIIQQIKNGIIEKIRFLGKI